MSLTSKQGEYLQSCARRWNCKVGAVGSGKSYVDIAATIPKRVINSRGEGLLILMGNTRGTLERNILEPMRQLWPGLIGKIRNDNTVDIFGKKMYALGADNKKSVEKIQGATFEYVYGDEITTWSQEVFDMLKSRLRCAHSCFDGTCNPANPRHWFKQFLDSDADIYCQKYVIDDGVLPANVVNELKKEYAGTMYYNRLILGEWCQAEGLVYPQFNPAINTVDEHGTTGTYYVSIDYGTKNPTVFQLWRLDNKVAYLEREYFYDGRNDPKGQKTNEDYYRDLVAFIGDIPIKRIIIDPSASLKVNIRNGKEKFLMQDANNSVLEGIGFTRDLIQSGKIKIHTSCKNALDEVGLYRWDEKKVEDAVIKENDHSMDAMRYMAMTLQRKFTQSTYKPIYMR